MGGNQPQGSDTAPPGYENVWNSIQGLKNRLRDLRAKADDASAHWTDSGTPPEQAELQGLIDIVEGRLEDLGLPKGDAQGDSPPEGPSDGGTRPPAPHAVWYESKGGRVTESYDDIWDSVPDLQKKLDELKKSKRDSFEPISNSDPEDTETISWAIKVIEDRLGELGEPVESDTVGHQVEPVPPAPQADEPEPADSNLDTGHYDDAHAFGWKPPTETGSNLDTGHYDDAHAFGWKPPTETEPEAEAPKSSLSRVLLAIGGVVVLVGTAIGIVIAALSGGGKTTTGSTTGQGVPSTAAPTSKPTATENPPPVSGQSFYIPSAFEIGSQATTQLGLTPSQTTWSADVNAIGESAAIKTVFQKEGFLSEGQQTLQKTGVNAANDNSWPQGSSVIFEWKVTYFQTPAGATAAAQADTKNLLPHQVDLPGLASQGITAFQAVIPNTNGIVNQIWTSVRGSAFIVVQNSGRFNPGSVQPDQLGLFNEIVGSLNPWVGSGSTTYTKAQAAQAYQAAAGEVNKVEPPFWARAMRWTASTTNAKAMAEAAQLLATFQDVRGSLLNIADAYPRAAGSLEADAAAVGVLVYDLNELSDLRKIGVPQWLATYNADIATLTAKSNKVRQALGLSRVGY